MPLHHLQAFSYSSFLRRLWILEMKEYVLELFGIQNSWLLLQVWSCCQAQIWQEHNFKSNAFNGDWLSLQWTISNSSSVYSLNRSRYPSRPGALCYNLWDLLICWSVVVIFALYYQASLLEPSILASLPLVLIEESSSHIDGALHDLRSYCLWLRYDTIEFRSLGSLILLLYFSSKAVKVAILLGTFKSMLIFVETLFFHIIFSISMGQQHRILALVSQFVVCMDFLCRILVKCP